MSTVELMPSLAPRLEELLARHKEAAARIDWSYHEFLPLEAYHARSGRGRPLSEMGYIAVETALLTEAILPWYTTALTMRFHNAPEPIQEFIRLWTSEEDQHSTLLETYLLLTGNGDHGRRNRIRKQILAGGWHDDVDGPFEAIVYTSIQEMATRTYYLHAARACEADDPALARALRRIARDETLHMTFYRDVVKAHLEVNPDYLLPLSKVMMSFQMPGHVVPDARERADYLAERDLLGPAQYYRDVFEALWSYWELDRLAPSLAEAMGLKARLLRFREALRKLAGRRGGRPESVITSVG